MEHPIEKKIENLRNIRKKTLNKKIKCRESEMETDNRDHHLIYNTLGIANENAQYIDFYQNIGRLVYRYAGAFVEDIVKACFLEKFGSNNSEFSVKIPNPLKNNPKNFEIDCLINQKLAIEIKWRDATTDGDHVNKEKERIRAIADAGYTPIRLMFFKPNREQSIKIQNKIEKIYKEKGGEYYSGNDAFDYVQKKTGINLREILEKMRYL